MQGFFFFLALNEAIECQLQTRNVFLSKGFNIYSNIAICCENLLNHVKSNSIALTTNSIIVPRDS